MTTPFKAAICAMTTLCIACNNSAEHKVNGKDTAMHHSQHAASAADYAAQVNDGTIPEDTLRTSPVRTSMATVGGNHIHITYGSPGVKGRIIWGGLVAYDKVWVTGAHQATKISFSKDFSVDGKKLPAGDYAFFTIPGKTKWVLILNKNFNQHLADDYNESEDVLRVEVTPKETSKQIQRLTYEIRPQTDSTILMAVLWDKLEVALPINVH